MKAINIYKTKFHIIHDLHTDKYYCGYKNEELVWSTSMHKALRFETEDQINDLFSLKAEEGETTFNAFHNNDHIFDIMTIYTK